MNMKNIFAVIITLIFALLFITASSAQEKKVDKKDLPEAVLTSFHKSYPKADIRGTSIEKEDGKTYYEIESMEGSQRRDLLYTKDGKVAEIEEAMASNNVPDFVKSSVMKKYPDGEISKAEKVTSGKKTNYEIVVKQGNKRHEVVLDSKGNIQKMEKMKKENEEKEGKENSKDKEDND